MAATMDIGVIRLGVMGRNLALNFADHGYGVAGFDLDESKSAAAIQTIMDSQQPILQSR